MTTHYEYNVTNSQAKVITLTKVNPKLTDLLHSAAHSLRYDDDVSFDGKVSKYVSGTGSCCIIGHMLPVSQYDEELEGLAAASPTISTIIGERIGENLSNEDLAFLSIVQHVHDRSVVEAVDRGKGVTALHNLPKTKQAFDVLFPRNLVNFDVRYFELFLDADLYVVDDTEPLREALTRLASHYRYNAVR